MKRNKRWWVLALPLVLQLGLSDVAHAVGTTVEETLTSVATPRGVRFGGQELGRISNPHWKVAFNVDPNLVSITVETYSAGANPDDPVCPVAHNPADAKVNMTIVADLQAGATGSYEAVVDYTETLANGTSQTEVVHNTGPQAIPPVPDTGQVVRQPVCIY